MKNDLINGRSPEEIKLALRCCRSPMVFSCKECPYNGTCLEHEPEIDALALIEHYEQRIAKLTTVLAAMGVTVDKEKMNA